MKATITRLTAVWTLLFGVAASSSFAEIRVDPMFSDQMVLQRGMPVPVWGSAEPGEKVEVAFRNQRKKAVADGDGNWIVRLDSLELGSPGTMVVTGSNSVSFSDVLVGDVWLGSGQSNMAGPAGGYANRDEVLAAIIEAAPYPNLRLYRDGWQQSTPEVIKGFSALMFSFGQPLQEELDVPVGLIVGAVGGTPSGRWLSPEMLAADKACQDALRAAGASVTAEAYDKKYKEALARWEVAAEKAQAKGEEPPRRPRGPIRIGDLYADHVAPIVPYAIRGVLWDQGEGGTAVPAIDQFTMMGALIGGWRKTWGQGDFPFLYVQKPSGGGCAWYPENDPVTRMADQFTAQPTTPNRPADGEYRQLHIKIMQHPNTAMVTATDLGSSVHPPNKSGYGRRACLVALAVAYGRDVEFYGPIYESHKVEGDSIRISYTHTGAGLATRHGDRLQGFEIADNQGEFHWADARIDGNTVVLSSPAVKKPTQVRYGWAKDHTWANLFNKDGLPALTFSTEE